MRSTQNDILLSVCNNFANIGLRKPTAMQAEVYFFFAM